MNEVSAYRGHSIELRLKQVASGTVYWTTFIDANYCMEGMLAEADLPAVRAHAVAIARMSIDKLEAMAPA